MSDSATTSLDLTDTYWSNPGGTADGSWASTTRSPIALTDTNMAKRPSFVSRRRPWGQSFIASAVVALIVCLASANLISVYGDPVLWVVTAIPAAALGALIGLVGVESRFRLWWQIVFVILAQFIIGPLIALNDTTIAHIVPTPTTLAQGFIQTFGSFKYVISVAPPLGSGQGALMALWTLNLWTALLATVFAISLNRGLTFIAVVPLMANLAASALLGTAEGTARVACGVVIILLLTIWLSYRWGSFNPKRVLSAAIIAVIATALAVGGTVLIPQHRLTLRDRYNPPMDPHQYTSPLSGMRAYVKYHKKDTLLSVKGLPAGTPVRLAVMDRFDGNVWNLSDSSDATDSSDYRKVGDQIATTEHGERYHATFTPRKGLDTQWLPLAGEVSSITYPGDDYYYNTGTHSAIVPEGTQNGRSYQVTGIITPTPSPSQINGAKAEHVSQPAAKDVPDSAGKLATALTGKQSTAGKTAQSLAQTLKTKGWFSHGLAGDYPSLPGHGNYRIDDMLGGSAMVGDSEQYASAMALMARELGLPSRVVLGFLPKDKDGEISKARTSRGSTADVKTDFTGNDIAAWTEIDLKGYGWVAFYPTPKETKVPNKDQDLTPPKPKDLVRQPPVPLTDPLHDPTQARGQSALGGADVNDGNGNVLLERVLHVAGLVAVYGSPLWVMLLICAIILAIKAVEIAVLKRRGSPQQRIASGWRMLSMFARQSGVDTSGTRRDQARQIIEGLDVDPADRAELDTLCREADWTAFSGEPASDQAPADYWERATAISRRIDRNQPFGKRFCARLSLKGVFHRPRLKQLIRGFAKLMQGTNHTDKTLHDPKDNGAGLRHVTFTKKRRPQS
jgi:hypothetical protein